MGIGGKSSARRTRMPPNDRPPQGKMAELRDFVHFHQK
jgi:hypothetical protein